MSALPLPYLDEEELYIPRCQACGDEVLRADVCLRCGFCQRCFEYADDCRCTILAEDRYLDFLAEEYEDGRLGA
jgi:hypothetical protein